MGVEETLQNQHGSHLIDDLTMAGRGAAGGLKVAVRFGRGEALVPQMHGQGEGFTKGFGEGVGFRCLGADVAGHVEGIAEDDAGTAKFSEKTGEGFEVLLRIFADQGEDGLSGETQLVGDRDPNAAVPKIEAKQAGFHSVHLSLGTGRKPHLTMG
jgi:hypothetical protein